MTSVRCNLCGQEFDIEDDDLRNRMLRHSDRHTPEGKTASSNYISGNIQWILTDWETDND